MEQKTRRIFSKNIEGKVVDFVGGFPLPDYIEVGGKRLDSTDREYHRLLSLIDSEPKQPKGMEFLKLVVRVVLLAHVGVVVAVGEWLWNQGSPFWENFVVGYVVSAVLGVIYWAGIGLVKVIKWAWS